MNIHIKIFVAAFAICFAAQTTQTKAQNVASGTCGVSVTWSLDDIFGVRTLTISGSGDMQNYSAGSPRPTWNSYGATIQAIIVNSGVTNIGNYAFNNLGNLVYVGLVQGITSIGQNAFAGDTALTSITLPNSLLQIQASAFYNCGLTSITIPEKVTTLWAGSFQNCTNLVTVNYNANVTSMGMGSTSPFAGCSKFTTLNIGDSLWLIYPNMFAYCDALETINFSDSVWRIGSSAFSNCTSLTSITFPKNIADILDNAFLNCTGLDTVNFNAKNASVSGTAFAGCTSLTTINIGDSVQTIPSNLFTNRSTVTSVTMGKNVTTISSRAFRGSGIDTITIPESVIYIGDSALAYCTDLKTINFNAINCTTMFSNTLHACTNFTTLNMGNRVKNIPNGAFMNVSTLANIHFSDSLKTIRGSAFRNCAGITGELKLPSSVDTIGNNAFYGTNIRSINIGESTKNIEWGAFYNCPNLDTVYYNAKNGAVGSVTISLDTVFSTTVTTLYIGDSVQSISYRAFFGLANLTDVSLGNGLTSIGNQAFRNTGITAITIPESVTTIDYMAFADCPNLDTINYNAINSTMNNAGTFSNTVTTLHIGNSVITIPDNAFSGLDSLTDVSMGNSVASIGNQAFRGSGITAVTIPESVTTIDYWAFADCEDLETVNYNAINANEGIYSHEMFPGCTSLTTANIGNRVKSIPERIFKTCTALSSVSIGDSLTKIGLDAFNGCVNLEKIELPQFVDTINGYAFDGCTSLDTIIVHATTPSYLGYNVFRNIPTNSLYIPCLTYDAYSNNWDWSSIFNNFIINAPVDTTDYTFTKCWNVPYTDDNFTSPIYSVGTYCARLVSSSNCDSVVCLTLSEHPAVPVTDYPASICQGSSYSDQNFTDLTTAGYHPRTYTNVNGCDSTVRVNLTITPAPVHTYSATICEGTSYSDANFNNLTTEGEHSLTLQTTAGCDSIVRLQLSFAVAPAQELCMISVDMEYHNQIVWKKQDEVTAYNIYREGNVVGQYELAATIDYNSPNDWIDTASNARVRSYSYKISGVDTCGNESVQSAPHKTMHLTISQGMGSWNLIWTPYEGTGYSTYNIYRAVGETFGELTLVNTIPSSLTSYADFVNTGDAYVYYMVEIVLDAPCTLHKSLSSINSNIATNNPSGITTGIETITDDKSLITVYPNPTTGKLQIKNHELRNSNGASPIVEIYDVVGKLLQSKIVNLQSKIEVDISHLSAGIYFVKLYTDKGELTRKVIKE